MTDTERIARLEARVADLEARLAREVEERAALMKLLLPVTAENRRSLELLERSTRKEGTQ